MTFSSFSTVVWFDPAGKMTCEISVAKPGFPMLYNNPAAHRRAKSKNTHHGFKPMCVVNVRPKEEKLVEV